MRRMFIALVLGALFAMLVAGGVALAATEPQPGECSPDMPVDTTWCKGTNDPETLTGTSGQDRIEALAGDDVLYGLGETDSLYGQDGNDTIYGDVDQSEAVAWDALYGGNGVDELYGAAGVDVLYAGKDTDIDHLNGGKGDDVYVVKARAYRRGNDVVDETKAALGEGVQLRNSEELKPLALLGRVDKEGRLYFYPQ